MDDFASRFADFLESIATKVRALTVDRVDRIVKLSVLGIIIATFALLALIFLCVAVFRIVANYTSVEGAYAIFGGLFMVAGAFVWSKRNSPPTKDSDG